LILYLDTSAKVKLYADEPGSALVRQAVAKAEIIASNIIAYAETRAALARKHRQGGIDDTVLAEIKQAFKRDWSRIHRLPVNEMIVQRAGELAEQYGLRGYDSVHLTAAESLQTVLGPPIVFACFDNELNQAARERGMMLLEDS
jgi:predicted nucleic acid-binding protein